MTDIDVLIVGAGPVGLTLANILGLQGVRTLLVEERGTLIDYPRGVGLDDESCRIRSSGSSTPTGSCWSRWRPRMRGSAGPNEMASCSRWSTPNFWSGLIASSR